MVKSKKMSKSAIAIIVLSLLLVLSMVLGLTGAWFTDKVENSEVSSGSLSFGKVDINGSGVYSITPVTYESNPALFVDGDKITIADGLTIANSSTVKIIYLVERQISVSVTSEDFDEEDIAAWFKTAGDVALADMQSVSYGHAAIGGTVTVGTLGAGEYLFHSEDAQHNGQANGLTGSFVVTANVKVYAVQEGHLKGADNNATLANVKEAFAAAGYAGAASLTTACLSDMGLAAA